MKDDQLTAVYLRLAMEGLEARQKRRAAYAEDELQSAYVAHVVSTVAFYRELFSAANTVPDLDAFPLMDRDRVYGKGREFRSEEYFEESEKLVAYTNGTIARKLQVHFDLAGWYDFNYSIYEAVWQMRPDIADETRPGCLGVVVVTDSPYEDKLAVILPSLNASVWQRLNVGRTDEEERSTAEFARGEQIPILYGRPSALLLLAKNEARLFGNNRIKPGMILTSGENLYPDHRRFLQQWYAADIYDAYIATEAGVIGLECGHGTGRHVPRGRAVVEVVQPDGSVTREGTGQIVLTNLANWGHAFVRYQLGDQVTVVNVDCPCGYSGPSILEIHGREVSEFASAAGCINTAHIAERFESIGVTDYQVIQNNPSHFSIRWGPRDPSLTGIGRTYTDIATAMTSLFDGLEVELVPIHRTIQRGGKLRRFISHA